MRRFSVVIAGLGARGLGTYAQYQKKFPERMRIAAVADTDAERVNRAHEEFQIPKDACFLSAEEMFNKPKLADCAFITTQDSQHIDHAIAALNAGYDIILEKPISTNLRDCFAILDKAQEKGKKVVVCHVFRYTTFFKTIKNLISSGKIGEVVTIHAIENVGYWHQAHSFIRGNWRKKSETSPMILQKSCHDFDIFTFLTNKKCLALSSFGSLKYFNRQNAPKDATDRCFECPHIDSCPYSAYKIYLDSKVIGFRNGNKGWPVNVVLAEPTEDKLKEELKTSPYGRCVFRCDNDVVDHQVVSMQFEDDVTVSFTMTGFTAYNSRYIKIMGTCGEIVGNQEKNTVVYTPFGEDSVVYDINKLATDLSGHGGGDNEMLNTFFNSLESGGGDVASGIANSIQSHVIALAAEESRLNGGKTINLDEFVIKNKTI